MKFYDKDAATIHLYGSKAKYWIYNSDKPTTLLMVHGFRGNHLGLKYIIENLSNYRIVVPDLPGFGESMPMTDRLHNIDGFSDFIIAFIKAEKIDHPVLIGHSFGTIIAAHLAANYPETFSKLILLNPIASSPGGGIQAPVTTLVKAYYSLATSSSIKLSRQLLGSKTFSRMMSLSLSRTRDPKIRRLVYNHHLADLMLPQHRQVIAEAFTASMTKTALDDASRITLNTLIIAGMLDPIAPPKAQKNLNQAIKGSKLLFLPKVGHLVHLETPEMAADAIATFIG